MHALFRLHSSRHPLPEGTVRSGTIVTDCVSISQPYYKKSQVIGLQQQAEREALERAEQLWREGEGGRRGGDARLEELKQQALKDARRLKPGDILLGIDPGVAPNMMMLAADGAGLPAEMAGSYSHALLRWVFLQGFWCCAWRGGQGCVCVGGGGLNPKP